MSKAVMAATHDEKGQVEIPDGWRWVEAGEVIPVGALQEMAETWDDTVMAGHTATNGLSFITRK